MKLTKEHYTGLKIELPSKLSSGSSYLAIDTNELFTYGESMVPKLVGDGIISDLYIKKDIGSTYNTSAVKTLTQLEYDNIVKEDGTLYFIKEE